jgi:hypothetical protein
MMYLRTLCVTLIVSASLTGCTALKNLTGKNDDSVLPGSREDVLPRDQQTARDPIITGEQSTGDDIVASPQQCNPKLDPGCVPPIDQEATAPENQ